MFKDTAMKRDQWTLFYNKHDNFKSETVDTGDEMIIGLYLMLIVIAGGTYYQLTKRS